jgi:pentose-5-phosphate-3-epimerase
MTAVSRIADWHAAYPGRVAGSVYAVPPAERARAARDLADAGLDVHVDMMADDEGLPAGVGIEELRDISRSVDRASVGVQLIGSPRFVDAMLPEVLAARPGTVFLPWDAFSDSRIRAVRDAGSAAWIALWDEWDGVGTPHWPARPDGVLVMLLEPGTAGMCRMGRLEIAAACAAELPVIVDGGVTEEIAPLCVRAGVQAMVVGRALLAPAKGVA